MRARVRACMRACVCNKLEPRFQNSVMWLAANSRWMVVRIIHRHRPVPQHRQELHREPPDRQPSPGQCTAATLPLCSVLSRVLCLPLSLSVLQLQSSGCQLLQLLQSASSVAVTAEPRGQKAQQPELFVALTFIQKYETQIFQTPIIFLTDPVLSGKFHI